MSSFDRRTALSMLAAAAAALGGCGYRPAGRDRALPLGRIAVEVPGGREAFLLEEQLETRLGRAGETADYHLVVELESTKRVSGASGSGGIDRLAIDGKAEFEVLEAATGRSIYQGDASASASWSMTAQVPASLAARQDAADRMLAQIAERIVSELAISYESWRL